MITATCTGFKVNASFTATVKVDGTEKGRIEIYSNNIHNTLTRQTIVTGMSAGDHTIEFSHDGLLGNNDYSQLTILELPF